MLVYVLNQHGKPLMPCSPRKARILLKSKKAKVVKREPFTIQLLYGSSGYKQDITLGVDAGSKHIGISATTEKKELYAGDLELRNDIVDLLATRRQNRRTRRNRLRYREPRFNNRVKSKHKGWLAPSIEHKIQSHLTIIDTLHRILPITKIVVEVASFDTQKLKNPNITNEEYQKGNMLGFWNVREFVLYRDNHTCQACKGKSKCNILNVHHIESRKTGGNAENNLITLCEECHKKYHQGLIKQTWKRGASYRDGAFMGIMRWTFYERLKGKYENVSLTYGYITKNTRIHCGLPKDHYIDARCISGNPLAKPLDCVYYMKKVRCQNRQIHKANFIKGGRKVLNQAQYIVKGFRLFDKVRYENQDYYIFGRRNSGFFDIRNLDGTKVNKGSLSCKKIKLIETKKSWLIERREEIHPLY